MGRGGRRVFCLRRKGYGEVVHVVDEHWRVGYLC